MMDVLCGLLWCFYKLFGLILSFWRHPFTAGDLLVSDGMLKFSKSVQMQKKTDLPFIYIVNVQQIFIFGRNIPLNI